MSGNSTTAEALLNSDPRLRVETLRATLNPQQLVWLAAHQDYSENAVVDELGKCPVESKAGSIAVKRLLSGGRGHYGCYSSDTEVMTTEGWVPWPLVTEAHHLAAVDIDTGEVRFEQPKSLQKVELDQSDRLYCARSQRLDISVTLDHRMVVSRRTKEGWSDWSFATAAEIAGKAVRYRVAGHLSEADRKIPPDVPTEQDLVCLFKLAGFFYGDGLRSKNTHPRCLRFRLRRQRKIRYIQSLGFGVLDRAGDRYRVDCGDVAEWIAKHFSFCEGKRLPAFVVSLPSKLFEALLDGLKNSDGTLLGRTSWGLDSVEKEALDLLQAACHVNGIATSLTLNNPNSGEKHKNHRPCWRLTFLPKKEFARFEVNQKGRTRGEETLQAYRGYVYCATVSTGALLVRRNLKPIVSGNCLEHPQITFNVCGYPHSVMQQARTHRVGTSFDVQSARYTGRRFIDIANDSSVGEEAMEDVVYLRPVGIYVDRQGEPYEYTAAMRHNDLCLCEELAIRYRDNHFYGMSEEHNRGILPFDFRQHFVVSFNMRSLMHFLDLRAKPDAQLEIQAMAIQCMREFKKWAPEIAEWYEQNRWKKGRLAP